MSRNLFENNAEDSVNEEDAKLVEGKSYVVLPALEEGQHYVLAKFSNGRNVVIVEQD